MTDNKPALIWALFFGGIIIVFTPFIGIVFAYMWKGKADAATRAAFEKQIKVFWRCAQAWLVAVVLMGTALVMDDTPVGSGIPLMFSIGVLVGVVGQFWFYGRSAFGLAKSLRGGQPKMATA
ncbi:MAG: hypothetical protein AAGK69_09505 [Pseudomonadota bacterium]